MRGLVLPRLVVALLLAAGEAGAQGHAPTPEEQTRVISILGLGPGNVVAEIGAGDGQLAIRVAKAVSPGGRVYATELGDSKRETLKRNAGKAGAGNMEVIEAQISATGLPRECCDAVFMRDVYHHLTAADSILADLRKSLRPGGRLLIIDFEPRASLSGVEGVKEDRRGHGIPMSVLVGELRGAGFEVVSQDPAWRSDLYAVVARLIPPAAK